MPFDDFVLFSGFGEGEVWLVVGEDCSETREDDLVLDCSL